MHHCSTIHLNLFSYSFHFLISYFLIAIHLNLFFYSFPSSFSNYLLRPHSGFPTKDLLLSETFTPSVSVVLPGTVVIDNLEREREDEEDTESEWPDGLTCHPL